MKVINTANNNELADNLVLADTFLGRMRGLLGRDALVRGEGLWIKPCKGVHTFGMRFPIDVVFLDRQLRVIAVTRSLPPNRLTRMYINAASVLELPSDTAEHTATVTGDRISIK
jgi:uncharacterized membrane protein (UPF0127 family)